MAGLSAIAIDHGSRKSGFAVVDPLRVAVSPIGVYHGPGDGDGLLDIEEDKYGTDPFDPDTDRDGLGDAHEVDLGVQLRTLYDEHYRSLVKMAAFYLDDVWSCEEVVQDAFVKLLTGRRVTAPGTEGAYLRSAVLNGARSQLRKRKVRREKQPIADGPAPSPEPAKGSTPSSPM